MIYARIHEKLQQHLSPLVAHQIKAVVGLILLFKLNSRDFTNFALWPDSVLLGYPIDIYPPDYVLTTGVFPFFDLVSFHFVHWFLPVPSATVFFYLQSTAIILSLLLVLAPIAFTRVLAVPLFILITYLWGFVYRGGQDIDAMFLITGALLIMAALPLSTKNYLATLRTSVLIWFFLYYFFSGVNKVVDLNYLDWFKFELTEINKVFVTRSAAEGFVYVPGIPTPEYLNRLLDFFGALISYIVHLLAPLMLISRSPNKMFLYWLFYSLFHFMTLYVGILFTANFFAWLMLVPFPGMIAGPRQTQGELKIVYDGECPFCSDFIKVANLRGRFESLSLHNARVRDELVTQLIADGYKLNSGMVVIMDGEILYGDEAARFIVINGSGGFRYHLYKLILQNRHLARMSYPVLVFLRKLYFRIVKKPELDDA